MPHSQVCDLQLLLRAQYNRSPDCFFCGDISSKVNLRHSIIQPSRAVLRKFPQMLFSKFDNNRSLTSIICKAYLVKTFFGIIHNHPPKVVGSPTSPLLKSTYFSVKSAAYITAFAWPRFRLMCKSNSFGATAAHNSLNVALVG